jgi:hypothetical protein
LDRDLDEGEGVIWGLDSARLSDDRRKKDDTFLRGGLDEEVRRTVLYI